MEIVCVWHKRSTGCGGREGHGCGIVSIGERGETEAETVVMAIVRTERAAKEAEAEVGEEEEGGQPQLCASTHWQTEHYELKLFSLQQQQEQ